MEMVGALGMMEDTPSNATKIEDGPSRNQFSISSMLWITAALASLLSYARWLGADSLQHAMIFAAIASAIGLGFGWLIGNWRDCFFWSLLMTLLTYLAVAGGRLPNVAVFYGWGIIGAICGSMSVMTVPKNRLLASMLMGIVSCLAMIATIAAFRFPFTELILFDVGLSALLGAMFQPFLHFLQWFEKRSRQPRILLASWLTISVLIGNVLVPVLGGVER